MTRLAVVDDEPEIRDLVATILEQRGYDVERHESFAEAEAALTASPPDLLICDVQLPDGDGIELVGRLRATRGDVPAIILSGRGEEKDFARGFASGAVDYLVKPFTPAELLARCALHLSRAAAKHAEPTTRAPRTIHSVPLRDGLAFGRYEIQSILGKGGAGVVYRALDTGRGGAPVALKVLLSNADEEARLRFLRETYALSSIRHPRIVAIHDLGAEDGRLYYAMELVEGETLRSRVDRLGPLTEGDARLILRGLADALVAIEEARILHRDLKPDNVILRGRDIRQPVLVDFGLAKRRFDRGVTAVDFLVGTPGYMAPEVIRGETADRRSDIFGLGLTIRAAITGEELFPHLEGNDLLLAIAAGPIPIPQEPLTPGFAAILGRMLVVEPDDRFDSARALLSALDALEAREAREARETREQSVPA